MHGLSHTLPRWTSSRVPRSRHADRRTRPGGRKLCSLSRRATPRPFTRSLTDLVINGRDASRPLASTQSQLPDAIGGASATRPRVPRASRDRIATLAVLQSVGSVARINAFRTCATSAAPRASPPPPLISAESGRTHTPTVMHDAFTSARPTVSGDLPPTHLTPSSLARASAASNRTPRRSVRSLWPHAHATDSNRSACR